jgi:hypothetical protein
MALQYSGSISMGQINVELGRGASVPISLDAAENGTYSTINLNSANRPSPSNPASMSEWYGYNHSAAAPSVTIFWQFSTGVCSGDYFQLFKNGTLMVNTSVNQGGSFTAVFGDVIEIYVASGIKGITCDNASYMVNQDGAFFTSGNVFGYSEVIYDSFGVASGVGEYEVFGYIGMVAPE